MQGYIAATSSGTTITIVDDTDTTQPPFTGSEPRVVLLPYVTGHTCTLTVGLGSGTVSAGSLA